MNNPPFTPFAVFQAMTQGLFRDLDDNDRAAFAGAPDDALIGTVSGCDAWQIIVAIGDEDGKIIMEAIGLDADGDPLSFAYLPALYGGWTAL